NDPHVILADEPTGDLDTKTSIEIMRMLRQMNKNGKTIIMVTHENDIAQWARRVIRLRDGHVESDERNDLNGHTEPPEAVEGVEPVDPAPPGAITTRPRT